MKRRLMILLIVAVLAAALCLTVSAAKEASGFRNIGTAANLTVAPQTAEGAAVQDGSGVWVDSDRLTVTYTAATQGKEYLVLLVSGSDLPTESDAIRYIDQKTAEDTEVTFDVYPMLNGTEDMTLFITSNDGTTVSVSLQYYLAFTPGDVNDDGVVSKADSLRLKKYLAGQDVEINEAAADVTGDGMISKADSLRLKKYLAGQDVVLGS